MMESLIAFFQTKSGRYLLYLLQKYVVRKLRKISKAIKEKKRDESINRRNREKLEESQIKQEQQDATKDHSDRLGGRT